MRERTPVLTAFSPSVWGILMIPGTRQLEGVLGALTRWGGDRETLTRAAYLYSSAAYYAPEWPPNIRRWNERILMMLSNGGSIQQTIAKADTSEALRIADTLLLFARAALISKATPLSHSPVHSLDSTFPAHAFRTAT